MCSSPCHLWSVQHFAARRELDKEQGTPRVKQEESGLGRRGGSGGKRRSAGGDHRGLTRAPPRAPPRRSPRVGEGPRGLETQSAAQGCPLASVRSEGGCEQRVCASRARLYKERT